MKTATLVVIPTFFLLLFGGLGFERNLIELIGLIIAIISVFFVFLKNKKISFPYGFSYFLVFFLLSFLSQVWSRAPQKGLEFLTLFASGGLFWVFFSNLEVDKRFKELFGWSLTILGLTFGLVYLFSLLLNEGLRWSFSLAIPYTQTHHHLGDYWVLPLLFLLTKIRKEGKPLHLLLIFLGVLILAFSLSRSSYVSLILGSLVVFHKKISSQVKLLLKRVVVFSIVVFLVASLFKTTLYSRIYFLQGLLGITQYPWGVGFGNFLIISREFVKTFSSQAIFSSLAHNIFLEVFVGMGILGVSFLSWFYLVSKKILENLSSEALFTGMFFALSANFFFDTTYMIPTMFWLWFMTLGLVKNEIQR
ncbi:MAG: O-antigen ligase family protein [Patescibacteria group bacterium]